MSTITGYAEKSGSELKIFSLVTKEDVKFSAFLTSFAQTFTSNWNAEVVYGRNDPIGNFQGTQRTLNVAWDVPAANWEEAKENLGKMNKLTKMLYPKYSVAQTTVKVAEGEFKGETRTVGSNALSLSKPPLIRLQFANLIKNHAGGKPGLLGWIGNFSWTPAIDMGMFTVSKKLYPKVIALSIDFTVQHEHDLGTISGGDTPATFPFGG